MKSVTCELRLLRIQTVGAQTGSEAAELGPYVLPSVGVIRTA